MTQQIDELVEVDWAQMEEDAKLAPSEIEGVEGIGWETLLRSVGLIQIKNAGSIAKMQEICDLIEASNIGYDQYQRWSFFVSGKITPDSETDCSAGCGAIIYAAGYSIDLSGTFFTGNFHIRAKAAGFKIVSIPASWSLDKIVKAAVPGSFLLTPGRHVVFVRDAKRWWSAENDERGKSSGGKAGDQTGREVRYRAPYMRPGGWSYLILPPEEKQDDFVQKTVIIRPAGLNFLDPNIRQSDGKLHPFNKKRKDALDRVLNSTQFDFLGGCEIPEEISDFARSVLPGGPKRWLVWERFEDRSQRIIFDSDRWTHDGSKTPVGFGGERAYHGGVFSTYSLAEDPRFVVSVGEYHLPPNSLVSQSEQRGYTEQFTDLMEAQRGLKIMIGDGMDNSRWADNGWLDLRTSAKSSSTRNMETYKKGNGSITDRMHALPAVGGSLEVAGYNVKKSREATDHNLIVAALRWTINIPNPQQEVVQ